MPKEKASPKKATLRGAVTRSPNKGHARNTRSRAARINYVESSDDEGNSDTPAREHAPVHDHVKVAKLNAERLAGIAASTVWGERLQVKIPGRPALKAHAMSGAAVPEDARDSIIEIWRFYHNEWRQERREIERVKDSKMRRVMFDEHKAVIWISHAQEPSDVKAFCVIEPEKETHGRNQHEDVVWLLHLCAQEDYDKYNLQIPLIEAVKQYCYYAKIPKNVVAAARRASNKKCSNAWIDLLEQQGFRLSEDSSDDPSTCARYERIVPM